MDTNQPATPGENTFGVNRRDFLRSAAVAGAGLMLVPKLLAQDQTSGTLTGVAQGGPSREVKVALVGGGRQGRVLLDCTTKIPNVKFVAVCDIWEYSQVYCTKILKAKGHEVTAYTDFEDMLAKEPSIEAVIIATPDFTHHTITNACLRAGKHVYCEKEMSNSLENARSMVLAQRETGKLLQIGHQRRSNPRYFHALAMVQKQKLLGQLTNFYGQWNRPFQEQFGWPEKYTMSPETLAKYGYGSMNEFANWRHYKQYSGGLICDLGSHQIDIFNWFLGVPPTSVIASGGIDAYTDGRQWYDAIYAIYEYKLAEGKTARGVYEVLTATSHGGFYETFMGTEGSMVISEDTAKGNFWKEAKAEKRGWEDDAEKIDTALGDDAMTLIIGKSRGQAGANQEAIDKMMNDSLKPPHQPHVENFLEAITDGKALNCPVEHAYETAVTVLKVNEAIEKGCRIEFSPDEFKV